MQFFNKGQIKQAINKMLMAKPETRHIVQSHQNNPELLNMVIEDLFSDVIEDMYPFKHEPVTPRIFLEDGYYCGKNPRTGTGVAETMYPILKDEFCKVHDINAPYREVVATGGIGFGKSFFMELGLLWHLYLLSCFKNPQKYFGLSQVSKIGIMVISITEKQSKKNIFGAVKEMIKVIDYFKENFYFDDKRASESLQFPNNIEFFNGSSAQSSAIGLNIFSAALDEANFFKVVENSKRGNNPDGMYDEALVLYNSLLRRQESRFLKEGRKPGILYVGSSRMYPNDFTEQRIKLAKEAEDKTTYVLDYNLWKVNRERYSKEEFKIEVGGLNRKSRILDGNETDVVGEVISVPMDFYDKFRKDMDNALRDIAGVAVYSVQPFIGQKEKIQEMFDASIPRIFSVDKATLSSKPQYESVERIVKFRPDNRDKIRYVAMDIGLKKDKLGFAMGYIEDLVTLEREFLNDETQQMQIVKARLPIVKVELLLQVYPEAEFGEVELSRLRFLIFKLKKLGYKIKYGSADGFQSADMQQILRRNGVNFDYISMDKTTEPYETFRTALYENRVKCIYHPVLEDELNRLERNYVNDKIDHPVKGCFVGDTEIEMADGSLIRIDDKDQLVGKMCKTYDINSGNETVSEIKDWKLTKYVDELIELEMENGKKIRCTPDHRFLLKSGIYKRADELNENDDLQD